MEVLRINLSEDGSINAIGYVSGYSNICPEFISFDNFSQYRYKGRGSVDKLTNWELLPHEEA